MMCENCGEHPATMHLTTIVNGEKSEKHLCAACAQEQKIPFAQAFDIGQLLSGFMQDNAALTQHMPSCPKCGMDLRTFKQGGLLGCAECYSTFQGQLEPLLNRIHGHVRHVGKIPARGGEGLGVQREIEKLGQEIKKAVALEQFEKAAELRDKIRALEAEREAENHG